jgi:hypothetical protein
LISPISIAGERANKHTIWRPNHCGAPGLYVLHEGLVASGRLIWFARSTSPTSEGCNTSMRVFTAMIAVKEGRSSFADALIGALGAKVSCSHALTFDQKALRLPDFKIL